MEKALSYLFLLGSLGYTICASSLSFGVLSSPKAGFLPIISGMAAVLLASMIIVNRQYGTNKKESVNWRKLILLIAGMLFYLICLMVVGYVLATFWIMLYLLKCTEVHGWLVPAIISAAVAVVFYGLFDRLLYITLP